jgi:predicted nucleic acid-binding Zn ribbon protein
VSRKRHRSDEPIPLRDAITAVGNDLGLPPPDALARVASAWTEVAGAALSAHTRVRSVRDGEAVIEVDGPAWATQIRYLASDLMTGLDERCGARVITSLRVVVSGSRRGL